MQISAVIICFNEETHISKCLTSLQDVVDEIIVVDGFSTDKTNIICNSFAKVKWYQTIWQGYSQTKNYGNSLATYPWILSLDADEQLDSELQKQLLILKKNKPSTSTFFSINILTSYCGQWIRYSGLFPDRHIRLFYKDNTKWDGDIHEQLVSTKKNKIIHLKGLLYHYSMDTISQHFKKIDTYTSLFAQESIEKGLRTSLWRASASGIFIFFKMFIIQRGFLDGGKGFILAVMFGCYAFTKYAKLWILQQNR